MWTLEDEKEDADASSRAGRIARQRKRQSVHSVYMSLGDTYFRRAYRMSYDSFRRLHKLLAMILDGHAASSLMIERGGGGMIVRGTLFILCPA